METNLVFFFIIKLAYNFSFFSVLHPIKMACGFLATAVFFMIFIYVTNEKATAAQFKKNHPILSVIFIFTAVYFLSYMLKSLLVFSFGIILPIACKYFYNFKCFLLINLPYSIFYSCLSAIEKYKE